MGPSPGSPGKWQCPTAPPSQSEIHRLICCPPVDWELQCQTQPLTPFAPPGIAAPCNLLGDALGRSDKVRMGHTSHHTSAGSTPLVVAGPVGRCHMQGQHPTSRSPPVSRPFLWVATFLAQLQPTQVSDQGQEGFRLCGALPAGSPPLSCPPGKSTAQLPGPLPFWGRLATHPSSCSLLSFFLH